MARMEDRSVLPAGAGRLHSGRPWTASGKGCGGMARRSNRVRSEIELGGDAPRSGTNTPTIGGGRRSALDLEFGALSVAQGRTDAGLLPRQPALVGNRPSALRR